MREDAATKPMRSYEALIFPGIGVQYRLRDMRSSSPFEADLAKVALGMPKVSTSAEDTNPFFARSMSSTA